MKENNRKKNLQRRAYVKFGCLISWNGRGLNRQLRKILKSILSLNERFSPKNWVIQKNFAKFKIWKNPENFLGKAAPARPPRWPQSEHGLN